MTETEILQFRILTISTGIIKYLCVFGIAFYYYRVTSSRLSKQFLLGITGLFSVWALSDIVGSLSFGGKSNILFIFMLIRRFIHIYFLYLFYRLYRVEMARDEKGEKMVLE